MEQCPICKHYMSWYMEYRCGVPRCGWKCMYCGHDTLKVRNIATTASSKWEQTESLEQFRVGLEYHTDATHFGKAKGKSITTDTADTPQTERSE